jgi:thioredoxin-dependent peroxiredoxin
MEKSMLEVGATVPDMTLQDDQGRSVRLADLKGKPYVLYFYPADDTPGCTKQACSFRDNYQAFRDAGIEVYGVSPDTVESHVKFRDKYSLPFPLLADPDHSLTEAFGAWGEKNNYGKKYMGVIRSTFVIGPDGAIQRVYPRAKPEENATEILRDLGAQQLER